MWFHLLQRLCDNDPGVMGATLCPLFDLITVDVNSYKDLVISFVSILKQVAERRLPKSYDYHQMPAPFIQVCCIFDLILSLFCLVLILLGKQCILFITLNLNGTYLLGCWYNGFLLENSIQITFLLIDVHFPS